MADAEYMKGWFRIPNIRPDGDRTIAEQMLGLERALAECAGKDVLDLGCAEGAISAEFARAGARRVVGIELLETHLQVARKVCAGLPVEFMCAHLTDWMIAHQEPETFDTVLALGIIHKLNDPNVPLVWAAKSARDLLCFRAPSRRDKAGKDYTIRSKFNRHAVCNVPATMREQGFVDEGTVAGVRGEGVQYWRRVK